MALSGCIARSKFFRTESEKIVERAIHWRGAHYEGG